jgi:hypothetical protein
MRASTCTSRASSVADASICMASRRRLSDGRSHVLGSPFTRCSRCVQNRRPITGVIFRRSYIPLILSTNDRPMKNRIAVALFVLVPILMLAPSHAPAQETSEGSRKVMTKVVPQYPNLARSMRLQGVVRADVLVAPNGTVKLIAVKGGQPVLVDAAEHALREWKWDPRLVKPTRVWNLDSILNSASLTRPSICLDVPPLRSPPYSGTSFTGIPPPMYRRFASLICNRFFLTVVTTVS